MTNGVKINDEAIDSVFLKARTFNHWQKKDVADDLLKQIYDLAKMAPTSANCSPARIVFVKSAEQKERLKPHMDKGNVDKTMSAPVTAIIAQDRKFYEYMPKLFPHTDAKSWFVGKPDYIESTMRRNATLQGGYFILAARSLGLDCGPMSGFDAAGVKKEFFPDLDGEIDFLCNLGYGDAEGMFPRSPRFDFDDVCKIV